ncbi:MAG: polyphosphate:AMP phosphotransferase [Myxococcota bacterium]
MLESVPETRLSKKEFEARTPELRVALLMAQRALREAAERSVLLMIAGDDRPGATSVFNRLHEWLDARYLVSRAFGPAFAGEDAYPAFWRYWRDLPAKGRVGVWFGGWPQAQLAKRVRGELDDATYARELEHFEAFERGLAADGVELVKLWVHLPAEDHEKRLKEAETPNGEWRLDELDWKICDDFETLRPEAEALLLRTDRAESPWQVLHGGDAQGRDWRAGEIALAALERAAVAQAPPPPSPSPNSSPSPTVLDRVDLSSSLEKSDYRERRDAAQRTLFELVNRAEHGGLRTVLVFEGWDAAGKGGAIRRITQAVDARDTRVFPIAAPSGEEHRYPYLWRFWRRLPPAGRLAIFDRSWYGRVLVERIEGFAQEADWRRAYAEINDFEAQLAAAPSVVLKFWLHIDPEEQLRRFEARKDTPHKRHKITDEDYRNREKWAAYTEAVHEMVVRTDTPAAPWHLVPANDKRFARVAVLEHVVRALGESLG